MKATTRPLRDPEFDLFRRLVEDKSGIALPSDRRSHLEEAVSRALGKHGSGDASALYHHLASGDGHTELEELVASLTIGETHFFRNKPQFEALERQVLPELIRLRLREKRLRIWSAGCASGEEPYSLAILLDRILPHIDTWNITILGTDIDRCSLEKAVEARYRSWSFRGVAADVRSRYFVDHGEELELAGRIRDMVTFEYLNLVDDAYPSLVTNTNAMDLIVCRNVLIYFREESARSVIGRLHRAMADGAWLFLGHAEPSHWVPDGLTMQSFPGAVAYRRSTDAPVEAGRPSIVGRQVPRDAPVRQTRRPPERRLRPRLPRSSGSVDLAEPESSPAERCDRAMALWDLGDIQGALAELEVLTTQHPDDPRPPYLVAKIYAGRLDFDAAGEWGAIALERDRFFAPAHHLQGVVAAEDGRLDDAADALRRCVYADPDWPLGHFALAETLLRLGQRRRAMGALRNVERLVDVAPPDEAVAEGEGLTVRRLRELAEMQKSMYGLTKERGEPT